ncbi:MAG TPA: hypothetical protein VFR58_06475 [Flavisolibacter sp.]|nr:hypothetical protein [Flavisolibacter sp.]
MKKAPILCLLVMLILSQFSIAKETRFNRYAGNKITPSVLVVDADVSVILLADDSILSVSCKNEQSLSALQFGLSSDTLTIRSSKKRRLPARTIIYVPAKRLQKIFIHRFAEVVSARTLKVPRLDIIVEGPCEFSISNQGDIAVAGTYQYDLEYTRKIRLREKTQAMVSPRKSYRRIAVDPQ